MCVSAEALKGPDQEGFRRFCHLLQSVFHFEYHSTLEALKDNYAPLNPDRDTRKQYGLIEVIKVDIDEAVLFARGEGEREETVSSWFGWRKKTVRFSNYDRVVLYIKYSQSMVARRTLYRTTRS